MANVVYIDEKNKLLREISYVEAHSKGLLHSVSVVYLYNDKGEILVQHRDDGRLDHSSAGHVDPGETYLETAIRELYEELGVKDVKLEEFAKAINKESRPSGDHIHHKYTLYKVKANPGKINKKRAKGSLLGKTRGYFVRYG